MNGVGESSEVSATATPVTTPGTPRSFTATAGNTQVTLGWQAPSSDGGSAITKYRYRVRRTDSPGTWSPDWTDVTGGGSATSQVVTGLTNDVNYTFELRAVNTVGESSSIRTTATPALCTGAVDGTLSGSGTTDDPYIVCSSNHLGLVGSDSTYSLSSHYKMGKDVDLNNVAFTPIGVFTGTFDGNGKKIKKLSISSSSDHTTLSEGLFRSNTGTIKNLGIENFSITASGNTNITNIGSLVGYNNEGTISNCYAVDSDAQVDVSVLIGTHSTSISVGGLVGTNSGTIISSYATGAVTGGDEGDEVGGLVGTNSGAIISSYAKGAVTGGDNGVSLVVWLDLVKEASSPATPRELLLEEVGAI